MGLALSLSVVAAAAAVAAVVDDVDVVVRQVAAMSPTRAILKSPAPYIVDCSGEGLDLHAHL